MQVTQKLKEQGHGMGWEKSGAVMGLRQMGQSASSSAMVMQFVSLSSLQFHPLFSCSAPLIAAGEMKFILSGGAVVETPTTLPACCEAREKKKRVS